jgi:argininosuccinate lyase
MAKKQASSSALWGGRFSEGAAARLEKFSESVSYDWRLYRHDIAGSMAHATMLEKIGILTRAELAAITKGLRAIQSEIEAGAFEWKQNLEDVHMNIEAALTARVPAGAKLHTGRSRNDQVATDVRLWLRDEIARNRQAVQGLQLALVRWADRAGEAIIPGYTHLQRAQPVLLGHHLLAYVEMLQRDDGRLADAARRADVLPLGSGAIAGSTLPLDRRFVAKCLGFSKISENSMDAVSDRDFIVEYASVAALAAIHLSRLSEDLILWSSAEFGFIRIGDAYTTGSSLMPQKKNPDIAELTRGKSGRMVGNLMALLTLLKGLPMTYNRDLQEDKERLFDTADTLQACLEMMAEMLTSVEVRPEACRKAAADPLLLATDLADWLVTQGMAFREAHHVVGALVALAEKRGLPIHELPPDDYRSVSPALAPACRQVFSLDRALANRATHGSPNPTLVRKQILKWLRILKSGSPETRVRPR